MHKSSFRPANILTNPCTMTTKYGHTQQPRPSKVAWKRLHPDEPYPYEPHTQPMPGKKNETDIEAIEHRMIMIDDHFFLSVDNAAAHLGVSPQMILDVIDTSRKLLGHRVCYFECKKV